MLGKGKPSSIQVALGVQPVSDVLIGIDAGRKALKHLGSKRGVNRVWHTHFSRAFLLVDISPGRTRMVDEKRYQASPIVICGAPGTGKTVLLSQLLQAYPAIIMYTLQENSGY
jgi:Cdc6-like AAA superfamily ATPase